MNTFELERYHCVLQTGYVAFSEEPAYLCTVCGAGVVVTLWDKWKKMGGMVHCTMATLKKGEKPDHFHADVALPYLINRMKEGRTGWPVIEAQLFGGGGLESRTLQRAEKVAKVIRNILTRNDIKIVSEDTGGVLGKKIMFDTYHGTTVVIKTPKIRKTDWVLA